MAHTLTTEEFLAIARQNPRNAELLGRLPALKLNECHLAAGCLFQAAWNHLSGRPVDWGVSDYDIFYFDDRDLSWEAEDAVIQQASAMFADLDARIELRNQARVHLWYPERFNATYPQLHSARDGIDRYLIPCTCVGIDAGTGELYAPNGLDDLTAGILRMNPLLPQPEMFRRKAQSYRERWPWLTIA